PCAPTSGDGSRLAPGARRASAATRRTRRRSAGRSSRGTPTASPRGGREERSSSRTGAPRFSRARAASRRASWSRWTRRSAPGASLSCVSRARSSPNGSSTPSPRACARPWRSRGTRAPRRSSWRAVSSTTRSSSTRASAPRRARSRRPAASSPTPLSPRGRARSLPGTPSTRSRRARPSRARSTGRSSSSEKRMGEKRRSLERLAPTEVVLPGGGRARVHYARGQPPWIESRIQDFFGQRESPRIGGGAVPLVVRLLSPAKRPVQITTDLAGFWEKHYPGVRRELSRRYPKHEWPIDPLRAKPPRPGGKRR
ncbi:hypothetical protein HY251_17920, partial [bacterium]|nr:hypothetical protein [bacterium]